MPFLNRPTLALTFLDRCRLTPDLPAYSFRNPHEFNSVTWKEHFERVRLTSLGLMRLGVGEGDRVAIISSTRYEWAVFDFAILGAKAISVPVYSSIPEQEIKYLLEHSNAVAAVVEDEVQLEKILRQLNLGLLQDLKFLVLLNSQTISEKPNGISILSLEELHEFGKHGLEGSEKSKFETNLKSIAPDDLYTIVYTSGTTGTPKGVKLTHKNFMSVLQDSISALGSAIRSEKESTLTFLPFSHIFGRIELASGISFGFKMSITDSLDSLFSDLKEVKPSLLFAVPSLFERAYAQTKSAIEKLDSQTRVQAERALKDSLGELNEPSTSFFKKIAKKFLIAGYQKKLFSSLRDSFGGNLRMAIVGGAALPLEVAQFFQVLGIQILEGYGLTETCGPVTLNTPKSKRLGTVGKALGSVKIKIAPDGEILLQGPNVFKGYENDESATSEAFEGSWLKSGDVGHLSPDGFLTISDRKKDIFVLSNGKNVAPQKLEAFSHSDPRITECVVYGDGKPYVVAMIAPNAQEVISYANREDILFSDYQELLKSEKVRSWIGERIGEWNQKLASFERIRDFFIHSQDLAIGKGELTPSHKVRRRKLHERFRSEFESLYEKPGHDKKFPL